MCKNILFIALSILSLTTHSFVDKENLEECEAMFSSLTSNEDNLKAAILYDMNQMPTNEVDTIVDATSNTPQAVIFYDLNQAAVTETGAIIDATTNTSGTLSNSKDGMPILASGANPATRLAWNFSQTDNYIRVASNETTSSLGDISITSGITVGFWAELDYSSSHIHKRVAGMGSTFDIVMYNQGFDFRFQGENYKITIPSTIDALDGTWQHFVVTFDFTTGTDNLVIYLDGMPIGTESYQITASFNSTAQDLIIGAHSNAGNFYPGKLDDFIVFDEAISSDDVMTLYTNGAFEFVPQLPNIQTPIVRYSFDNPFGFYEENAIGSDYGSPSI